MSLSVLYNTVYQYQTIMTETKPVHLTLFHMDNCTHCIKFKPVWENIVKNKNKLKNVDFGDYERSQLSLLPESERTINGQEVEGFPTLKVAVFGKEYNYQGERTEQAILEFIKMKLEEQLRESTNSSTGGNLSNAMTNNSTASTQSVHSVASIKQAGGTPKSRMSSGGSDVHSSVRRSIFSQATSSDVLSSLNNISHVGGTGSTTSISNVNNSANVIKINNNIALTEIRDFLEQTNNIGEFKF